MKKNLLRLLSLLTVFALLFFALTCTKLKKEMLVSTGEITNLLTNTADASGQVIDLGDGAIQHGHCWAKIANVDVSVSTKTQLGAPTGAGGFTSQLTSLDAGTKYYIKAYLSDGATTVYGKEINFITTAASAPTLTTSAITTITTTSAISGGNITIDGGAPVTARGVCWSTATGPSLSNDKTSDGSGAGTFTSNLTGLFSGTTYYVRAYATNSAGTTYGNERTFTSVTATTVPGSPTIGTATAGNAQAIITFTAPGSNGGSVITGYTVTSNPGNITGTGSASPITVTGLTNGTAYTFTVTATNAIGTSVASTASNSVTPTAPSTAPGAPTIGTATAGNAQATVTFTVPVSNGGSAITGYTVTSNPGNITGSGSASPITVTGLTNGTAYTFTVTATNAIGTSVASSASNTVTPTEPSTAPGAPTIGTATPGNAQATITFIAPGSNGGSTITGYTATSNPGNITGTGSASPITVTGLTNGTAYTFTVTATNAIGTGPTSSASNSVTPSVTSTIPGAPTGVSAAGGNAQATVAFTAPLNTGGSAITGYTVTSSPGGFTGNGPSSPITVNGLINGITYTFTVTATNAIGTGPVSSASNSVTPSTSLTVPGAPTGVSATGGYVQAIVTFTGPVSNGGSSITGYTVTSSPGGFTGTGTASPITVNGLPALIAYTFTVTATNAIGTGPSSSSSNSVTPTTVPDPPTIGTATKGNAQATISFTVPVSNGGSAITGYTVTSNPGAITGTGSASPLTVTGLTNGTSYTFTVTATNSNGIGPASAFSNSVIPSTVPGAPIIGTATKGNAQATVTFTLPVSDGGSAITGYTVTSNPGSKTGSGTSSPIIITGLTNGTSYTFTVTASNSNGTSSESSVSNSVIPSTIPDAPTIGTATKGNGQANVAFTAPASNGGSAVTTYTATSSPGGYTGSGSTSPITVPGLTNGTSYTFTVFASNINGDGPASAISNSVTPSTVPGAPIIGTATKGNNQASISFTTPVSDGGSAITLYTVTSNPDGKTGTGLVSPIIVLTLINGTPYTFTVTASNINGVGAASTASNSVIPSTVPGAPTIGTAIPGNAQAAITFTAPVSDGGSAISGYTVTSSPGSITGIGSVSPIIVSGLTNGTAYSFNVVATNLNGNSLASAASNSVTPLTSLVLDIEGNAYNTVTIGSQVWMKENMKATKYNDGTTIPNITLSGTWAALTTGAYSDYNNIPANSSTYGRLYNWFATDNNAATKMASNGGKNVCPTGWHIPSDAEWTTLENYLIANGYNYDGTTTGNFIAKSLASDAGWVTSTTTGAVGNTDYPAKRNATGFTAIPGGNRVSDGSYNSIGGLGMWWSSTVSSSNAWFRGMSSNNPFVSRGYSNKQSGFSIRCIKD
jgi:uncharacterized protein (TIGR02145 family)